MLPKYCIGDLALAPGEAPPTSYEDDLAEGQFYHTLKKRVEAHFREKKACVLLAARVAFWRANALTSRSWTRARTQPCSSRPLASSRAWLHFGMAPISPSRRASRCACARVQVSTAAHVLRLAGLPALRSSAWCNEGRDRRLSYARRQPRGVLPLDALWPHHGRHARRCRCQQVCICASCRVLCIFAHPQKRSFMWRQQHVVGHHAFTNVDGMDPDIRVGDRDVRRVTGAQPWHSWHALQHVYLGVLYGLLAFKSIYIDDFVALAGGAIGAVRLAPQTRSEAAVFWGGKAAYAAYMLAAPLAWSHHSLPRLLALWATADAVTGWMLAFMFQVAHVVDDVSYPARDPATGRVPLGWAAGQVATTADFCHGSWFWTHVSGGLNYQARFVLCVRMKRADQLRWLDRSCTTSFRAFATAIILRWHPLSSALQPSLACLTRCTRRLRPQSLRTSGSCATRAGVGKAFRRCLPSAELFFWLSQAAARLGQAWCNRFV